MIRVLIVDDERLVRAMLRTIMQSAPDISVLGEAGDGAEAVRLARKVKPDVVIMDIRMPRTDGLAGTEQMGRLPDPPKVVILTTFDLDEYVYSALRAGAVGFLLKDATADEMLTAVRSAASGNAMLSPKITRRLLVRFTEPDNSRRAEASARLQPLTLKEREVMQAIGQGLANSDIASALFVSEATVKTHVSRILSKLALTNRVQAAILAHHAGLLD